MEENNNTERKTRNPMMDLNGKREEPIKCSSTEYEIETNRAIVGWNSIEEVANSVWNSIHSRLLEGDLVFAYKTGDQSAKLKQIVIVRNFELIQVAGFAQAGKNYTDFGVGYITSGYTALLPHVPLRYVKDELYSLMKDCKVPQDILGTFGAIIEDLEEKQ